MMFIVLMDSCMLFGVLMWLKLIRCFSVLCSGEVL